MTYEKKYNELVGKIEKAYLYAQTDSTKAVLEEIRPELSESEGERIRKALMRFHKSTIDVDGIKGDDIIAWLEKQAPKPKWSENDEEELEIAIETLHEAGQHSSAIWLKSLKKRMGGEQ